MGDKAIFLILYPKDGWTCLTGTGSGWTGAGWGSREVPLEIIGGEVVLVPLDLSLKAGVL